MCLMHLRWAAGAPLSSPYLSDLSTVDYVHFVDYIVPCLILRMACILPSCLKFQQFVLQPHILPGASGIRRWHQVSGKSQPSRYSKTMNTNKGSFTCMHMLIYRSAPLQSLGEKGKVSEYWVERSYR